MNPYYQRLRRFLFQEWMPITKGLLLLAGIFFVLGLIVPVVNHLLALSVATFPLFLWSIVTYPLVNRDLLGLIFAVLWLWMIGGTLERSWGGFRYLAFLIANTAVTGLVMIGVERWLAGAVAPAISGLWLLTIGLTWAWAELNPRQELLFWGIIPIQARWLAWITAALIFFSYYQYHWLLGLGALVGIPLVYLFRRGGGYRGGGRKFDPQRWMEERKRQNRKKRFRVIH